MALKKGLSGTQLLGSWDCRHCPRRLPSAQSGEKIGAGSFAPPAGLSTQPAVLVNAGVALTFGGTAAASNPAGFQHCPGDVRLVTGVPGQQRTGAAQISAQSRLVRMHLVSSATMSPLRQASAQAVQVSEQAKHDQYRRDPSDKPPAPP